MFALISEMKISAITCCTVFILLSTVSLPAQQQMSVDKQQLTGGVSISYKGSDLAGDSNFLVFADSSKSGIGLVSVSLDGNTVWLKHSKEAVSLDGVAHWYDDEDSGIMAVDLSGIRSRILPATDIEVVLALLRADVSEYHISIYSAANFNSNQTDNLQRINDIKIEIN